MTVTIPAGIDDGTYKVNMSASGAKAGGGTLTLPSAGNVFFNIVIDCEDDTQPPTNGAPDVSADWTAASVGCRVGNTLDVTFVDSDSTSWTAVIDWEYDGTNFTNDEDIGAVTPGDGTAPSFSRSHAYNAPGTYTAAVRVTDNQGATGSDVASLAVLQTYTTAFLAPLDGSTPSKLIANTMKKGRVVPVKVTIYDDCAQTWVNDPATNVTIDVKTASFTANSTDSVETFSDAGASSNLSTSFRFNADSSIASGGFWIYNLDTNGFTIGSHSYLVAPKVGSVLANSTYAILKPTK
jgi:hypothetical protein